MDHETAAGIVACAFFWCCGGLHGLTLAWTQPARMRRWAGLVERGYYALYGDDETKCGLLCAPSKPCRRPGCLCLPKSATAADYGLPVVLDRGEEAA